MEQSFPNPDLPPYSVRTLHSVAGPTTGVYIWGSALCLSVGIAMSQLCLDTGRSTPWGPDYGDPIREKERERESERDR